MEKKEEYELQKEKIFKNAKKALEIYSKYEKEGKIKEKEEDGEERYG